MPRSSPVERRTFLVVWLGEILRRVLQTEERHRWQNQPILSKEATILNLERQHSKVRKGTTKYRKVREPESL